MEDFVKFWLNYTYSTIGPTIIQNNMKWFCGKKKVPTHQKRPIKIMYIYNFMVSATVIVH